MPHTNWPAFIRGNADWGSDAIMTEAEQRSIDVCSSFENRPIDSQINNFYATRYHPLKGWYLSGLTAM
jgi:hypothetical protein